MKIKNLADLAGVSISTVSKAFSGSREVSDATRERIFALAREHGVFEKYDKNRFCKRVIAVICPEVKSDYYSRLASQFKKEIEARDGIMLLSINDFSEESLDELYSYYTAYAKVDGVILFTMWPCSVDAGTLLIPTVFHAQNAVTAPSTNEGVMIDIQTPLVEALSDLKHRGHTRIGFVGETYTLNRRNGFCVGMQENGLPVYEKYVKTSKLRFEEAGMAAMREWIADGDYPTAIVAAYDYIALGVLRVLREEGLRVPEDVAVLGYDDIPRAPYLETSLSSIRIPVEESCRLTVELLMRKINDRYYTLDKPLSVTAQYVARESTGGRAPKENG